ncbi:MBL fold metallo-hydrolase [Kitasatospora sp. RB6PN24]|uniref:MBL fold metallo-hydrolase n=1 Tax=Kitasatospora humi TaxID=2893891 RepID=UPI001E383E3C|nr:MBL fold metallo-hydrolase [Kitasatospora humi]MCC9308066.1 MBL fold metallo-hydrolase [Kitasatospora humi]
MDLIQLTPTVWQLPLPVGHVHLVRREDGFAVVDTGVPGTAPAVLAALHELGGRPADLRQIVLTHSHFDHMGSAAELVAATGAEVLAGAVDAPVISGEEPEPVPELSPAEAELHQKVTAGLTAAPRHLPVDRTLADGDQLAGWGEPVRVLHVPGHTFGAIALHLPDSGVLFPGDLIGTGPGEAHLGPFNVDRAQAIASFHRLAALAPKVLCPPHGTPVTTGAADLLRAATPELDWA